MAFDYTFPVGGKYFITSPFGTRPSPAPGASKNHQGIDISVPVGTSVLAAKSGKITKNEYSSARGNYIEVDHGNGLITIYEHLSKAVGMIGDTVKEGQEIAKSGNSGISTGPHLHFEIRNKGNAVNPMMVNIDAGESERMDSVFKSSEPANLLEFIKGKWWIFAGGLLLLAIVK